MRAVGRAYRASVDGQQWLRSGQEHNESERAREAAEHESAQQAALAVREHRAPVMHL